MQHSLESHAISRTIEDARRRVASAPAGNRFAAKIRLASNVKSKCEEFNIWHAGADNVIDNGVDAAWGSVPKRTA